MANSLDSLAGVLRREVEVITNCRLDITMAHEPLQNRNRRTVGRVPRAEAVPQRVRAKSWDTWCVGLYLSQKPKFTCSRMHLSPQENARLRTEAKAACAQLAHALLRGIIHLMERKDYHGW